MGKVSTFTHFLCEPGCKDYSILDQAVEDFEQGPDSILRDFVKTPDLDASFYESDDNTSLVFFRVPSLG